MRRRIKRGAMWACVALAAATAALFAVSLKRPAWTGRGGFVAALSGGNAEFAWSGAELKRQAIAYNLSYPEGNAAILVEPGSVWRPSVAAASVQMGVGPGPVVKLPLTVLYVPLWPIAILLLGGAGGLWWAAGKRIAPGHCRACNYDLRGLAAERCPECGSARASIVRRLASLLGGLTSESRRCRHGV